MESIKLTDFKDIFGGKYKKDGKEYPLILGIRENQKGNRFITAVYIDNENNQINVLLDWEIDEIKEIVLSKIALDKDIYEKIKELKTKIQNFKEFFKILKSLKMKDWFNAFILNSIELDISEKDLAYWIYSKIYFGNIDKDTYLELVKFGENSILGFYEKAIERIAERFEEKGLNNKPNQNLTIEI
jgi:hypothetical protein